MEGIVKISKITAQAICTLSPDEFLLGERLAEEGIEAESLAQKTLEILKEKERYDTEEWLYIYIPDQRGRLYAHIKQSQPINRPATCSNN